MVSSGSPILWSLRPDRLKTGKSLPTSRQDQPDCAHRQTSSAIQQKRVQRPRVLAVPLAAVGILGGILETALEAIDLKPKTKRSVEHFFRIRQYDIKASFKHFHSIILNVQRVEFLIFGLYQFQSGHFEFPLTDAS